LIVKAYIDETGIHDGAPVTAVAAYFAHDKSWKKFTLKWRAALWSFGVDEFHMNDYAQRHGAFEGWSDAKQLALAKKIFGLIPEHTSYGASVAMVHADFNEMRDSYPHIKEALGTPYTCCFQWLITLVIRKLPMPFKDWRVSCIHEDNDYKDEAIHAWDWAKSEIDLASRLGTLTFAPKKDFVPLQAADVLAWETQKRLADPGRAERKSFTTLLQRQNVTIQGLNKQWLLENAPRLEALAVEYLRSGK